MSRPDPNTNKIAILGERSREKMHQYFAYGSNMDTKDLNAWCEKKNYPKITQKSIIPAKLVGYRLAFNYYSSLRKCGVANIMEVENGEVYGLLIEIDNDELQIIREKEGCPKYYQEIRIFVDSLEGQRMVEAITYKVAKNKESNCHEPPSKYYLRLIISNAIKHRFPSFYIEALERVETKE